MPALYRMVQFLVSRPGMVVCLAQKNGCIAVDGSHGVCVTGQSKGSSVGLGRRGVFSLIDFPSIARFFTLFPKCRVLAIQC